MDQTHPKSVSVIIPLVGDSEHLVTAICSAAQRQEVGEVLLIPGDRSDRLLNECRKLSATFDQVHLLHNPNPSKDNDPARLINYGISRSKHSYLAFLYPDGYFLPGRFSESVQVLRTQPEVDGIYVDVARRHQPGLNDSVASLPPHLAGSAMFDALVGSKLGSMDITGILIRKSALHRAGLFAEGITGDHEHCGSMIRASIMCNLRSACSGHPLTVRRIPNNDFSKPSPILFARLIYWSEHQLIGDYYQSRLLAAYLNCLITANQHTKPSWQFLNALFTAAGRWPSVMRLQVFWRCLGRTTKALVTGNLRTIQPS